MEIKISELLSCAIDAATRVSEIIKKIYESKDLHTTFKTSFSDPVTLADVESEKIIYTLFKEHWFRFKKKLKNHISLFEKARVNYNWRRINKRSCKR